MIKELALIGSLVGGNVTELHTKEVINKINLIAPHTSLKTAKQVVKGLKGCKGLEVNLILSIIRVESNFKINAFNKHSNDFGLMQVNEWHVKKFKYDQDRLTSDASYNMKIGCSIMRELRGKHNLSTSIGRYNCGYQRNCLDWRGVRHYIEKVLAFKHKLDKIDE